MLNKILLIGNVGQDPELKQGDGWSIASFSLATTKKWADRQTGEMKSHTEWHNVVFSGKQTETIAKFVKKGSKLYIEGENRTRSYEKDGITRYITEVRAYDFKFLDKKPETQQQQQATPAYQQPQQSVNDQYTGDHGDLPF